MKDYFPPKAGNMRDILAFSFAKRAKTAFSAFAKSILSYSYGEVKRNLR